MTTELSQEMKNTAKWVSDLMKADGVTPEQFASMPIDMIESYMMTIAKKIEAIQSIYLTRNGAQEVMANRVLSLSA